MTSQNTTRLKLFKAIPGSAEPFRTSDINANADKIDEGGNGAILVNSGARPAAPFEGMLIWETDTNKLLVRSGSEWLLTGGALICTRATRPTEFYEGMLIWETDNAKLFVREGGAWQLVNTNRSRTYTVGQQPAMGSSTTVDYTLGTFTLDSVENISVTAVVDVNIDNATVSQQVDFALFIDAGQIDTSVVRNSAQVGAGIARLNGTMLAQVSATAAQHSLKVRITVGSAATSVTPLRMRAQVRTIANLPT